MLKRTMSEKSGRSRKFYHRLLNPDTVLMLLNLTLHKQTPVFIHLNKRQNPTKTLFIFSFEKSTAK